MASPETRNTNFVGLDPLRFSPAARFVKEAVEDGAHFGNAEKDPAWERKVDITLTYYFGKYEGVGNNRSLSAGEVGRIFPGQNGSLTRARVWQILNETVPNLYQGCSPDIQGRYSPEALKKQLAKPTFLTLPKGTTRNIIADVDAGVPYTSLKERYNYDSLSVARRILEPFGIFVPYGESRQQTLLFIEQLKKVGPETDKETIKALLGQAKNGFMMNHKDIFDQYFISLSKLLYNLGFHFTHKDGGITVFINKLGQSDIPFGQFIREVKSGPQKGPHRYFFVFRVQKKQIEETLLPDPDLARFLQSKVSQITGVKAEKLPNTHELRHSGDYRSVGNLCRRLGIKVGGRGLKMMEDLLADCPCPVFKYSNDNSYFYPVEFESQLADFLVTLTQAWKGE